MLFNSHKHSKKDCGFCKQPDIDRVEIFGYKSTSDSAAICSSCILEIATNAIRKDVETYDSSTLLNCNFCGQSIPEVMRVFTNGELGICEECIANFISTSLWIGKPQGAEPFKAIKILKDKA